MTPEIELHLSLILFLPWFVILCTLYWLYPRGARGGRRRLVDAGVLVAAFGLSLWAMRWGFLTADEAAGPIWRQVLATLTAYGAFLAVLAPAWWWRWRRTAR